VELFEPPVRLHDVMIHYQKTAFKIPHSRKTSTFKLFFFAMFLEGEGDSEPDDARPSSFRKAGSESSATDSKIMKVSPDIIR
jgi:hypothetical protein